MDQNQAQAIVENEGANLVALAVDMVAGTAGGLTALCTGFTSRQIRSQVEKIEVRLSDLELHIDGNEAAFAAHVISILQASTRTDDELKLRMMRSAVVNLATCGEAGNAIQAILIKKLDDLSPLHLAMIKFLDEPPHGDLVQKFLQKHPQAKNTREQRTEKTSNGFLLPDSTDDPREEDFAQVIYVDLATQRIAKNNTLSRNYQGGAPLLDELGQRMARLIHDSQ